MAPSSHNTQPWRFTISGRTLELHADPHRQMQTIDRDGRQLVESCGCALMNARIAIRAMGYSEQVTISLVNRDHPHCLATVTLGEPRQPTEADRNLMRAISRRQTNRRGFLARPIPSSFTDELASVAGNEGVAFVRLEPRKKSVLASLVAEADDRQFSNQKYRDELTSWLAAPGKHRADGIPFEEKEYGSDATMAFARTMRSPVLGNLFGTLEESSVRTAPAVLVLGTEHDDAPAWLACGQALEAVLLYATANGFSCSFLNQVLEVPDLRLSVAKLAPEVGYPQMILRMGVSAEPIECLAPRRPYTDVIDN